MIYVIIIKNKELVKVQNYKNKVYKITIIFLTTNLNYKIYIQTWVIYLYINYYY